MSKELLARLSRSNLADAAFDLAMSAKDGVYKNEIASALSYFTVFPCSEAALLLIQQMPKLAEVLPSYSKSPCRMIPPEVYGPNCAGFVEYVESRKDNLLFLNLVYRYLTNLYTSRRCRIGFHSLRDQRILYARLSLLGVNKPWLAEGRQFLRDALTATDAAFRIVNDLVCIHGVSPQEVYWDGAGREAGAESFNAAEVLYDIGPEAPAFGAYLATLRG